MNTLYSISFLFCVLLASAGFGQMSKQDIRKKQWLGDVSTSGVGIELMKPRFKNDFYVNEQWSGINMLFGVFQVGIGQGYLWQVNSNPLTSDSERRSSNWYIGASVPIPFLTLGKYKSYNNSIRLHPIANLNFGQTRVYKDENVDFKITTLNLGLGYRARLPYVNIDFTLNFANGSWKNPTVSGTSSTGISVYPTLTFRWDGLLDKFKPTFITVEGTQTKATVTGQSSSTTTERRDVLGNRSSTGQNYRVTSTTTTYNVTSSPITVVVQDIGKYLGFGLKYSTNGLRSLSFKGNSNLFGAQVMYRYSAFVFGGTIEGGRLGHGSMLEERKNKGSEEEGDNFYRRIDKSEDYGNGSYSAFNLMADIGFDFSSLKYGLFGMQVANNDATSYVAITLGYSFGINAVWNQEFISATESNEFYDNIEEANQSIYERSNTYFEDPRQSKSGLMGGFFISCDIGHASMRMQWYKFRRAPLANGIMFSLAWRF